MAYETQFLVRDGEFDPELWYCTRLILEMFTSKLLKSVEFGWISAKWHYFYLSLIMRKRVFGSFRPGQTQTGLPAHLQKLASGLKFWWQTLETLHYLGSEQQRHWSDCANEQADLRLGCSHMTFMLQQGKVRTKKHSIRQTFHSPLTLQP